MVVTIPVDCPHCETRFQLSPEMAGKSMRCPECREVFVVQSPAAPFETPPADDRPFERVEPDHALNPPTLAPLPDDELNPPTIQPIAEDLNPPTLAPLPDALNPPTLAPLPDNPRPARSGPTARTLPTAPLLPGPKEVAWSGTAAPATATAVPAGDEEPFIRRRRRRTWPPLLLAGLALALVLTLATTGIGLYRYLVLTEDQRASEAEAAYKDANYPVARQKYEELVRDFPRSSDAEKYQFFADLSGMQGAVASVTARENPAPALKAFNGFVEQHGQSTYAQPETGFGTDVVQAGRRLAETLADHAGDKLKAFQADRKNLDELTAAEQTVRDARAVLPTIDRFRDRQDDSLGAVRGRYDGLEKTFASERHRLAVLAPFRGLPTDEEITAAKIEAFQVALKDNQLTTDAEALQMLADSETALRKKVGYAERQRAAVRAPVDPLRPVLFAAPVAGSPDPRPAPGVTPDTVFAVARGILYALDAETGRLLWGARVAAPTADPRAADLPTPVSATGGAADWVLVAGEIAGQPGLTARVARTGRPIWHQPLEAPPAARPVLVGGRVYLPLRDPLGKVVEFETTTGTRTGEFTLRQPVGAGIAVLPGRRPGLNYLFVPGDTRRVFVFEVGREDDQGVQQPPRCVRVFLTDHPRDSLRAEPVLIASADEHGPAFMILAQADGPQAMKLRAFPLPAADALAGPGGVPVEEPTPKAAEVTAPGWAWFPPRSNGERVVLATDAGAFVAFGVNQAGNADAPHFTLPTLRPAGEQEAVSRSQVVAAEEDAYWAVLGGQLVHLRTVINPASGFRIIPQGAGRAVGEPINRPQVLNGLGLGVVIARPAGSANVQAVGFDLSTGQVRWQRRLAVTPAGPPIAASGGPCVVADEDGGVYAVTPATDPAGIGSAAEVIARPFADLAGKALSVGSADGRTAWVLAPEVDDRGRRLRIRCVAGGKLTADAVVPLPDELAGRPVALGESVLIPVTNGYVYRFTPGDTQLSVGPLWRGNAAGEKPVCFLTPLGSDEVLVTDGGMQFLRWRWPAGMRHEKTGGPWVTREPIAVPPVAVGPNESQRLLTLDRTGVAFLFDADKPGTDPVRRWHGGEKSAIPPGKPTGTPAAVAGGTLVVYSIDRRHLVAIDPARVAPAWVKRDLVPASAGTLVGWSAVGDRLIATDQTGRVLALDASSGKELARSPAPPAGMIAVAPGVPLGAGVLVILADGSAATVPLPPAPKSAPAPTPKS
jgi:outer membrane protein assembly factor BamB